MITKINPTTRINSYRSTNSYMTPSFGTGPKADEFVKKVSLEEAISQIPDLISAAGFNGKPIPLLENSDVWGNLHKMILDIDKLKNKGGYSIRLSFSNPDGSNGSLGLTAGSIEEINSKLKAPGFLQKFKETLNNFSYHFNDEPEIVDLNG